MVDSRDSKRVDEAKEELDKLLSNQSLQGKDFLFFANWADSSDAMSIQDLIERLQLDQIEARRWTIQAINENSGEGMYDGLDWLCNAAIED